MPLECPVDFTVERVTGSLGGLVQGLDLTAPVSDGLINALSNALVEHKVLFFRDQHITLDQHLAFGRRFGPLEVHPFTARSAVFANSNDRPEVIVIEGKEGNRIDANRWHSDVTWRETPSLGSILRARIVPDHGGDTMWADMEAAYEGLDDATRSRISGLFAIHDWHLFREGLRHRGVPENEIAKLQEDFPPVRHPVVRTHPVSGRKSIYVNGSFTVGIEGMSDSESKPLLAKLYALASIPEYQVRFRWQPDSIAFWDNRSTQHYAVADYYPQHRRMERVTVAGPRPV